MEKRGKKKKKRKKEKEKEKEKKTSSAALIPLYIVTKKEQTGTMTQSYSNQENICKEHNTRARKIRREKEIGMYIKRNRGSRLIHTETLDYENQNFPHC